MKTLYLVRHGLTTSKPGVFCGASDVPLSVKGKRQSKQAVDELLAAGVELVITTGLQRSDYSGQLAAGKGVPSVIERGFREIDFGRWEGMTWSEIAEQYPDKAKTWLEHPETMHFPDGDATADFRKRIEQAWQRVRARPEQTIAVICHSGVLGYLLPYLGKRRGSPYIEHGEIITLQVT